MFLVNNTSCCIIMLIMTCTCIEIIARVSFYSLVWHGHTFCLEEEGSGNFSTNEVLWNSYYYINIINSMKMGLQYHLAIFISILVLSNQEASIPWWFHFWLFNGGRKSYYTPQLVHAAVIRHVFLHMKGEATQHLFVIFIFYYNCRSTYKLILMHYVHVYTALQS